MATGRVETNILTLHDEENADEYPSGHTGNLMNRRPVLRGVPRLECVWVRPALPHPPASPGPCTINTATGFREQTEGCYNCHPGPVTRDAAATSCPSQHGMGCTDCHGNMEAVAANPNPWLNEPRCDDCHTDPAYAQNEPLTATRPGMAACTAPAATTARMLSPRRETTQWPQVHQLAGPRRAAGRLHRICHLTQPTGGGPHSAP